MMPEIWVRVLPLSFSENAHTSVSGPGLVVPASLLTPTHRWPPCVGLKHLCGCQAEAQDAQCKTAEAGSSGPRIPGTAGRCVMQQDSQHRVLVLMYLADGQFPVQTQ